VEGNLKTSVHIADPQEVVLVKPYIVLSSGQIPQGQRGKTPFYAVHIDPGPRRVAPYYQPRTFNLFYRISGFRGLKA
jgi:hypothetical protein